MSDPVKMSDIARLAGVSVSTVSRALNNNASIPERTRQRIHQIAHDLNYQFDVRAQNFRLQRSTTVALVFPYRGASQRLISDPFYLEITGAIADEVARRDYDLIVARVPSDDDAWARRYVRHRRVDGVLMIDRALNDRGMNRLHELAAPLVVWGPVLPDQAYMSVGCDSVAGAASAVRHLIGLGRRCIGFIGGDMGMVETDRRLRGYREGLREGNITYDDALVRFTDFTPQAGDAAARALLDTASNLDAIFVCSDFMAVAVMQTLREYGRRVPDDVAVIGYDDIPLADHCSPRLTTVRQPIHEGGARMVEALFAQIDGQHVDSVVLPAELVIRESCGGASHTAST